MEALKRHGSDFTFFFIIVLGFNGTSNLVGHFVSPPRERKKTDRRSSRGDEREGHGTRRKMNKSEKNNNRKINIPPLPPPAARVAVLAQL